MPKLKAVRNRLLRIEDTHRYAVKIVDLNAGEFPFQRLMRSHFMIVAKVIAVSAASVLH